MLEDSFKNRLAYALTIRNKKAAEVVETSKRLFELGKLNKPLTKPQMSHYLKGDYDAKQDNLYALSLILNVDEAWLMGYDVPIFKNVSKKTKGVIVPILGRIPAGIPLEAIEDIIGFEEIPIEMTKGNKEFFGLQVNGTSMSPDYLDKDILIVEKKEDCDNGDDCIVMVNGEDATFKRVLKNESGIILQPLNNTFEPIPFTNKQIEELPVRILGVVVELRRKKKK